MPRGKKRKNKNPEEETEEKMEEKVAKIGEFATPKEGAPEEIPPEAEEIPEGEVPPEEEVPKEEIKITPEELKEKLLNLVSEVGSKGLTEEEKKKFIDDFKFWNEILFNALDIGDNLKNTLEKVKVQLTPTKAVVIYVLGTIALIFALRPDLAKKVFGKKEKSKEQKPPETPPPSKEEKVEPESK
jgi:hypothetical protein